MSTTVAPPPSIPDDISIFEQSSPESLRARAHPLALARAEAEARAFSPHELSSYTSDDQTLTDDDYFADRRPLKQCHSSRSSVSSFPASVIHHTPYTDTEDVNFRTPSRSQTADRFNKGSPNHVYLSAFRNPSSVRALQLESEYTDSDTMSLRNSERPMRSPKTSRYGTRSPVSVHSSPTKRSSRPGTPQQRNYSSSKLKKEFPLVLLHCTLLAPAVTVAGPQVSNEILEAVLPEEYRKRWQVLQDKVVKNSEVRQRGVLISHPREDYDQLEESLLETLELERPRIRRGHYLGNGKGGDSDSGFESSSQNGSDEASDNESCGHKCPDCGKAVSTDVEQDKKWEIKVFAANGLMRSGAWSAAWEQMEKVDVEVSVWMPANVRMEVEERLKALQAKEEAERPVEASPEVKRRGKRARSNTAKLRHDERMREIYGQPPLHKTQDEIDGLVDDAPNKDGHTDRQEPNASTPVSPVQQAHAEDRSTSQIQPDPALAVVPEDFLTFMRRHLQLICNDQKNIAIVLLSAMVLLFSFQNANLASNRVATTQSPTSNATTSSVPADQATPTATSVSYLTTTVYAQPLQSGSIPAPLDMQQAVIQPNAEQGIDVGEAPMLPAEFMLEAPSEAPKAEIDLTSTAQFMAEFQTGYSAPSGPEEPTPGNTLSEIDDMARQDDLTRSLPSQIIDGSNLEIEDSGLLGSEFQVPFTEDAVPGVDEQREKLGRMAGRSSETLNDAELVSVNSRQEIPGLDVSDTQEAMSDAAWESPLDAGVVDQQFLFDDASIDFDSDPPENDSTQPSELVGDDEDEKQDAVFT